MGQGASLWIPETSVSVENSAKKICEALHIPPVQPVPVEEAVNGAIISAKRGENAVIAAGTDVFCSVKLRLFRELSVKILRSSKLSALISEQTVGNSREYNIQTAVTENASLVISSDGLYSAVTCETGSGRVTILPADEERFNDLFEKGLPCFEKKLTAKEKLAVTVNEIVASGKSVSVADSGSSEAFSAVVKSLCGDSETFRFARVKEDITESDDLALPRLAKSARETLKTDVGAAIGNATDEGSISVCVCDKDGARTKVVHSLEGESEKHLMGAAVAALCEMINEASISGVKQPEAKPFKLSGKPLIIVIACLVAALIACFVMGFTAMTRRNSDETTTQSGTDPYETSGFGNNVNDYVDIQLRGEVSPVMGNDSEDPGDSYFESLRESIINLTAAVSGASVSYNNTTYNTGAVRSGAGNGYTTISNNSDYAEEEEGTVTDETEKTTREKHTLSSRDGETVLDDLLSTDITSTTLPSTAKKKPSNSGKFIFTVYGWGHGVGMSQDGAKALARQGKTCNEILAHYYEGTVIKVDPNTPMYTVVPDKNGKGGVTLLEFLCKTVKQEIGDDSPDEALKAQAVAAYTYAMYNGNFGVGQTMDSDYNYKGTRVEKAVMDVLHITDESQQPHCKYISYNGKYINAVYCDSMAGTTASAGSVWGMNLDYLRGGVSTPEEVEISTVELSVAEVKNLILSYGISESSVDSNPAKWFNIVAHDGAYNKGIGYVNRIEVCGVGMSGNRFREKFMHYKLRSHCFTIQYVR